MIIVRPLLKRLHSPDVLDLKTYIPVDKSCFGFLLQAMFGPEDADGEESFDMIVCTPNFLSKKLAQQKVVNGHYHVIVNEYNFDEIVSFLSAYGRMCESATWHAAALKLSKIGKWEFEDYVM